MFLDVGIIMSGMEKIDEDLLFPEEELLSFISAVYSSSEGKQPL